MSPSTMPHMGRKRKSGNDQPTTPGTGTIRVHSDLARMLAIIATATDQDTADFVSPLIRSAVERRYAEVVRQLGQQIKEGE